MAAINRRIVILGMARPLCAESIAYQGEMSGSIRHESTDSHAIPILLAAGVAGLVRVRDAPHDRSNPPNPDHSPGDSAGAAGTRGYQSEPNAVPDPAQSEANPVPDPAQSEANPVPDPAQSEANPGEGTRPGAGIAGRMAAPER
jgi:hypothetical protein